MAMSAAEQQELNRKTNEVQRAANRAAAEATDAEERRDKARRAVEQARRASRNEAIDASAYRECPFSDGAARAARSCRRRACAAYNRAYDPANGQSVCGIVHWMGIDAPDIEAAASSADWRPDRDATATASRERAAGRLEQAERELEEAEADLASKRGAEGAARAGAEAMGVTVGMPGSGKLKTGTR